MIVTNPQRTSTLLSTLILLWEASVRASHRFLTEEHIQKLLPFVKAALSHIETLIVVYDNETPIAFIGIKNNKLEMLFVSPLFFGKGIGKKLVTSAIKQYGVNCVDVNEQNPDATAFYRRMGFEVFDRTEYDEQGHPFPILKMHLSPFSIRLADVNDISELKKLFQNTVLTVNRRNYSQEEVEDWASCGNDTAKLEEMIKTHYFIVAQDKRSQIVGFSSITPQGYLHSMFVHKDFQRQGIAALLLNHIEQYAKENEIVQITSEVSLTARPFFEKRSYTVDKEQKRKANQLSLTNFWMSKIINDVDK